MDSSNYCLTKRINPKNYKYYRIIINIYPFTITLLSTNRSKEEVIYTIVAKRSDLAIINIELLALLNCNNILI